MGHSKENGKFTYKNFLLSIFDAWLLLNEEIPKKIEKDKHKEEIKEERARKLGPRPSYKDKIFSSTEISIIKELIVNPRKSYAEISKNLELSRHTVKKRIEEMQEQNKIQFYIGIKYQKLNLEFVLLTLRTSNFKSLNEIYRIFQNCPRTFLLSKDIPRNSIQVLLGVEKSENKISEQCINIIEKWQLDDRVKDCSIYTLFPELFPEFIVFMPKNLPQKDKIAPCGANCAICEKYIEKKCTGCPAFEGYRGSLFKTTLSEINGS